MAVRFETYVKCDQCGRTLSLPDKVPNIEGRIVLPPPWHYLKVVGWVGLFHVCSDDCESGLLARLGNGRRPPKKVTDTDEDLEDPSGK